MRRLLSLILIAAPLAAQVPTWTIAPTPITTIGVTAGDPRLELAGVLFVHRLADGRVLVADSVPLQLRLFDSHGNFLYQVGRTGSGPGEFRGRISLYNGAGDSLLVYDEQLHRWTLYTPDIKFVRSWPDTLESRERFDPSQYRGSVVHPIGRPVSSCYVTMIDALPRPRDTAYREIFGDGPDRAWLRDEGSSVWSVRSLAGLAIGRVTLPQGFELLQIGDGFVAGTRRDEDDVERVEILAVAMPRHAAAPACAGRPARFPRDTTNSMRALSIDLRNMGAASEAFRADYGHYGTYEELQKAANFTLSRETALSVNLHHGDGWDGIARNVRSHQFCRMLFGDVAPGWLYRYPFCGP